MLRSISRPIWVTTILLFAACSPRSGPEAPAQKELHVIGIYEGNDYENHAYDVCLDTCRSEHDDRIQRRQCQSTSCVKPAWPSKTSMSTTVEVDRPGVPVTLVLGAYDPMEWQVTITPGTDLKSIALLGWDTEGMSVLVNGTPRTNVVRLDDTPAPNKPSGDRFRYVADVLPQQLGFERIASFQGGYRAPAEGFRIDSPIDRPEFAPNYLQAIVSPIAKNHPMRIEASLGGKTGLFKINGDLIEALLPISSDLAPINSGRTRAYIWRRGEVRAVSIADNTTIATWPIPEERGRGHFKTMALDEVRNRLILAFQAGAAHSGLYALDLETGAWSEFGTTERTSPTSMFYDEATDTFLIVSSAFSDSIEIGRLTPAGFFAALRRVKMPTIPGAEDLFDPGNGPAPRFFILDVDGDKIALATDGDEYYSEPKIAPLKRVYEYDLSTGDVRLTFYE